MSSSGLDAINDHLALVEFAVQDLTETELVESAQEALFRAYALCRVLERYVYQRKEKGNGYGIQLRCANRQSGERAAGN